MLTYKGQDSGNVMKHRFDDDAGSRVDPTWATLNPPWWFLCCEIDYWFQDHYNVICILHSSVLLCSLTQAGFADALSFNLTFICLYICRNLSLHIVKGLPKIENRHLIHQRINGIFANCYPCHRIIRWNFLQWRRLRRQLGGNSLSHIVWENIPNGFEKDTSEDWRAGVGVLHLFQDYHTHLNLVQTETTGNGIRRFAVEEVDVHCWD